jgi:hypothetical protein
MAASVKMTLNFVVQILASMEALALKVKVL